MIGKSGGTSTASASYGVRQLVIGTQRVLLIGDSVMIGKATTIQSNLPTCTHGGPVANAQTSTYTLANLSSGDQLLSAFASPDVIIWNNGLWDAKISGTSDADYKSNLIAIARLLLAETGEVYFLETTDIPSGASGTHQVGRETQLNAIAHDVLPKMGIPVIEFENYTRENTLTLRDDQDDIHFSSSGYATLANIVTGRIFR